MIPQGSVISTDEVEEVEQPSYTYNIDFINGRVIGMVDGLEAIKQAVYKILSTERFDHLIYSADYGVEMEGLVGKHRLFVQSELQRRIREALIQDDRISDVTNLLILFEADVATVTFTVQTQFGDFVATKEVSI